MCIELELELELELETAQAELFELRLERDSAEKSQQNEICSQEIAEWGFVRAYCQNKIDELEDIIHFILHPAQLEYFDYGD